MGIFVNYRSNKFAGLANIPTTLVTAYQNTTWVRNIILCNRTSRPLRFNMQKISATGVDLEADCYGASTANLNATYNNNIMGVGATLTNNGTLAAFTIDGLTPAFEARILIKDQTNTFENGIYYVSTIGDNVSIPWVLTRTYDYDSITKIHTNDVVTVTNGTVNAATRWKQTSTVTVIGTSPITFVPETTSSIFHFNEKEIKPYETFNFTDITGIITLEFNTKPFVSDSLVCFSNGYTQVFDCDVNYEQLNELPMT